MRSCLLWKIIFTSSLSPHHISLHTNWWRLRRHARLQLLEARSQINRRLLCRIIILVPLRPIITDSVRENLPIRIEAALRYRLVHCLARFQLRPRVLVPETETAIGTNRRQRSVNRMECNIIHRVNVLEAAVAVDPMTFKRKVVLRIHRTDVLDGDATLDAAQRVARRCVLFVAENRHRPVLVLERRFLALEFGRFVLQRVDDEAARGGAYDGHGVFDVGAVATLRQIDTHDGLLATRVPELGAERIDA